MSESKRKIVEMLAQGKISADDAYRLLCAVDSGERSESREREEPGRRDTGVKTKAKYLRVTVTPGKNSDPEHAERINVRVPMSLVRAGIKLTALIPPEALDKANSALREKGINFDVRNIKPDDIEELVEAMGDMEVDVESAKGENIKVFAE